MVFYRTTFPDSHMSNTTFKIPLSARTSEESVGLRKSMRKFDWSRTDFVDFAGQQVFYRPKKRQNMDRPDGFAVDFP